MQITMRQLCASEAQEFWDAHFTYLVEDGIITEEWERDWFSGREYRGHIERLTEREPDRLRMVWFLQDGERVGATQYVTYKSEDGKCFILDFWVFPGRRGAGVGRRCFDKLRECTQADGARYWQLNFATEGAYRFWLAQGFCDTGVDEHGVPLMERRAK